MSIDEAIKCLRQAKSRGVKNIVFAFWEADMFDCKDDGAWADACDKADDGFDWSHTHDDLQDFFSVKEL